MESFLKVHSSVIAAFANRDRKQLLQLSKYPYERLTAVNPFIDAMYFVLPNNNIFLRIHKPDYYGDNIAQLSPLAVRVNKSKKTLSDIENVRMGPRYRICSPVFSDGQYIGLLGININIRAILRSQSTDYTKLDLLFAKQQALKMKFVADKLLPRYNSFLFPDTDTIFTHLQVTSFSSNGETVKVNDRIYTVFIGGILKNIEDTEVARILVATDVTRIVTRQWVRITKILLLMVILLIIMGSALYFGVGKVLFRLSSVQRELKEQNRLLEQTVDKRTCQLQEKIDQYKEIDRRYTQLTENSPDWIWEVNVDCILSYSNSSVKKINGYTPSEIIGTTPFMYISESDRQRSMKFWENLASNPVSFSQFVCDLIHKDGSLTAVEVSGDPLMTKDGDFLGYRARIEDISSEIKKREQQGLFREAFKCSEDAILLIEDDHFIDCNDAAVVLFGARSKEELMERHPAELSPDYQMDGADSTEKRNGSFAMP